MRDRENDIVEQLEQIGRQILIVSRNELYLSMRFLDVALSSFTFVLDEGIGTIGTDGFSIFYGPAWLGGMFRENPVFVNRAYLHMALHGIFRHMTGRGGRQKRYYDLACDIAVESVIDGMTCRCVRQPRSFLRRETYRKLEEAMKVSMI